ncbi:MAG TPA: hypothetical protein VFL79_19660, partial [Terriglobia bacterium]|nr:hypothetical protein [Terriglobia bacterium]
MKNRFSKQQMNYAAAKAIFDVAYEESRKYDRLMDAECEKLGIPTPYGILPEGHPMRQHAQELLDKENAAKELMYTAARDLFDWATSETFKHCGTPAQQAEINSAVAKVKKMAWVEQPFEQ